MSRWTNLRNRAIRWLLDQIGYYDCASTGAASPSPAAPSSVPAPEGAGSSASPAPSAKPWRDCRLSSNWDGAQAARRMMNLLSPKFSAAKVAKYLDWQQARGCDHVHLILVNDGDGEGAGYDCCTNAAANAIALERVLDCRNRGLGVVLWIVTDDSDSSRAKIFANPAKWAKGAKNLLPYASAVVLGLEMDEHKTTLANWQGLRDALRSVGWAGPIGTHHTSGNEFKFASLGDFVCGQLSPGCSEADVKKQVKAIRAKGKDAVGFEYEREPARKLCLAAFDAGAIAVGNWDGGDVPSGISTASAGSNNSAGVVDADAGFEKPSGAGASDAADAVELSLLDWAYGGFKGGSAKLVDGCRIGSLKVSSSGLSYKWERGGCEALGASGAGDYSQTLACLFCRISGKWRGGKFDWISTSRTTRSFENIQDGYNGWPKNAVEAADAYAFCIVSKDGKRRSNVIAQGV